MDFYLLLKNMGKSLSNKYGQKRFESAIKSTTDAIKIASKRAIQKTAETAGNYIGNKIADKITSVSKNSTTELHNFDETKEEDEEKTTHTKRHISPEERQKIRDDLWLVPKKYVQIKIHISRRKTTSY